MTIDTIMNINNNLNNNLNSNNNNDRNNNNNNMFESMNMNERRAFDQESVLPSSMLRVQQMMSQGVSPWDRKVFETLREGKYPGLKVMQMWVTSVVTMNLSCALVIPCLVVQDALGEVQEEGSFCPSKSSCPLFTS